MKINEIQDIITDSVMNGDLNNSDLVQLMEHSADYLNLKKLSVYHNDHKDEISLRGIYKCREVIDFRGFKFVADND